MKTHSTNKRQKRTKEKAQIENKKLGDKTTSNQQTKYDKFTY